MALEFELHMNATEELDFLVSFSFNQLKLKWPCVAVGSYSVVLCSVEEKDQNTKGSYVPFREI